MYIGIDLGTSGVKVIVLDEKQNIVATEQQAISISRPKPLWSEQNPNEWWQAVDTAMSALNARCDMTAIKAIGLTGQMHGAVLLDKNDEILYPAILWNDGRSMVECKTLAESVNEIDRITGNLIMPGFTAPKLLWMKNHKAGIFKQIVKVLLPKDYIRLLLTGEYATDMSDASGTMWLDVGKRQWSSNVIHQCGLDLSVMPQLFEGNQITGYLRPELAERWGLKSIPIVAGGGDNAAGAIGVGLHKKGQAMLSLGTSGVYFVVTDTFLHNPQKAVHSFCHALPHLWHLMSVTLSAASAVDWVINVTQASSIRETFHQIEKLPDIDGLFLPYLSGERTPHNNPKATGVFWGLTHNDDRFSMAKMVVEGVSFALAQGVDVLHQTGISADRITLIGGGAKSEYWRQLLADVTGVVMEYRVGGDVGPALGAARLAQMAVNPNESIGSICQSPPIETIYNPNLERYEYFQEKQQRFAQLYENIKGMA